MKRNIEKLTSFCLLAATFLAINSCSSGTGQPISFNGGQINLEEIKLYRSLYNLYPLDPEKSALKKTALDMALILLLAKAAREKGAEDNEQIKFYKDVILPQQTAYRMAYAGWESKKNGRVPIYTAGHILKKGNDQAFLENLRSVISSGKSTFEAAAVLHSDDRLTGAKGGKLHSLPESAWPPSVLSVLKQLNTTNKRLSAPVKTEYGWHLFYLYERETVDQYNLAVKLASLFETDNTPATAAGIAAERFIKQHEAEQIRYEESIALLKCGLRDTTLIPPDFASKPVLFEKTTLKTSGADLKKYLDYFEPELAARAAGKPHTVVKNFILPACVHHLAVSGNLLLGKDYKSRLKWDYEKYLADLWWKKYYQPDNGISEDDVNKDLKEIKGKKAADITDATAKLNLLELQNMPEPKLRETVSNKLRYLKAEKNKQDFITKIYQQNNVKLADDKF